MDINIGDPFMSQDSPQSPKKNKGSPSGDLLTAGCKGLKNQGDYYSSLLHDSGQHVTDTGDLFLVIERLAIAGRERDPGHVR